MSKRTFFTTVTPLPPGITRETVMDTLRNHVEMIDLNPLVEERHPIKPPPTASPEEFHCQWYSLTDRVQYLPGGMASGKVSYTACFHDLANGLQTHCYAPLGLNIKGKWTMGGSLPGEPIAPVELGLQVPLTGLWLREDVELKCNFMMTSFVKGTIKKAHSTLVGRLLQKAQILEANSINQKIEEQSQKGSPVSEYSQQSFSDHNRVASWAAHTQQAQDLQSQHGGSDTHNEKLEESSLHPKPLSIRSSTSGSVTGSQGGRSAYQESNASGRVSWQTLNASAARSPQTQYAQPAGQRDPNSQTPQSSPPGYPPVELRRQESWNQILQNEKQAGQIAQQQGGHGNMPPPEQYGQQHQGQYPPGQYQQQQGQYPQGQYQQQQGPPGHYQQQQGPPGQHQQQQQFPPQELHDQPAQPKPQVFEMA